MNDIRDAFDIIKDYPVSKGVEDQKVDYDTLVNLEGNINPYAEISFERLSEFKGIKIQAGSLSEILESYPSTDSSTVTVSLKERKLAGANFVKSVANNNDLWADPQEITPWNDLADDFVTLQLNYQKVDKAFLVGVLDVLRDAKRDINPRELASGFLVLSQFSLNMLKTLTSSRIDFQKTCDAGCKHSIDVVRAAAVFTRRSLGFSEAVA